MLSQRARISAPIFTSGSITLPMGRLRREGSPVIIEKKSCPVNKPSSRRMVVPELPASNRSSGSQKPLRPLPRIQIFPFSCCWISTPSASRHCSVLQQSAPFEKLCITVFPSAMEPISAARWDMDLSPGTQQEPFNFLSGVTHSIN